MVFFCENNNQRAAIIIKLETKTGTKTGAAQGTGIKNKTSKLAKDFGSPRIRYKKR